MTKLSTPLNVKRPRLSVCHSAYTSLLILCRSLVYYYVRHILIITCLHRGCKTVMFFGRLSLEDNIIINYIFPLPIVIVGPRRVHECHCCSRAVVRLTNGKLSRVSKFQVEYVYLRAIHTRKCVRLHYNNYFTFCENFSGDFIRYICWYIRQ